MACLLLLAILCPALCPTLYSVSCFVLMTCSHSNLLPASCPVSSPFGMVYSLPCLLSCIMRSLLQCLLLCLSVFHPPSLDFIFLLTLFLGLPRCLFRTVSHCLPFTALPILPFSLFIAMPLLRLNLLFVCFLFSILLCLPPCFVACVLWSWVVVIVLSRCGDDCMITVPVVVLLNAVVVW